MEKYLQRLEAGLSAGLAALAEAVEAGAVAIESGELRLPRRKPAPKDPRLEPTRQALARAFGDVQFPEVLIEVDVLTRFSWILLGRPARSEQELVTLYRGSAPISPSPLAVPAAISSPLPLPHLIPFPARPMRCPTKPHSPFVLRGKR